MALRTLQTNAADKNQIKRAERFEQRKRERFDRVLGAVLATSDGRALLSAIIDEAGVLGTSFDHSGSVMCFKEGRRNYGLEIRAACVAVDEDLVLKMDQEATARRRADQREIDAGHTAAATEAKEPKESE